MHVEPGVAVVESDDEPERHQRRGERIHEAPAEGVGRQGPAEGVNDRVERAFRLPDLLHSQGEDLRVRRCHALPLEVRLCQHPARPLGERRHPRDEIGRGQGSRAGFARPVEPRGGRAHAGHALAVHQQRRGREAREDVDAQLFRLGAQPAHDLAQRPYVIAPVVHGGRNWKAQPAAAGQQVDGFLAHGCAKWKVRVREVGEQVAEGPWVHDGAGEGVLP